MTAYRERTNAELIQAIRDEDKWLGEHAMLSARIIHNNVVVMQAAYLEAKAGKGDDVAVAWIENLLIDSDNVPKEEYGGAGDLQNAHDPDLYFRDNHLDGELSPYQSRMDPLIDEMARRLESVTAERDRISYALDEVVTRAEKAEAELAKLREQKPVAWINLNKWTPSDGPRCATPEEYEKRLELLTKLTAVYAAPVPAVPAKLIHDVERCLQMLLTEPDTKGALFKAENILREALADAREVAAPAVPDDQFRGVTKMVVLKEWCTVMKELADDAENQLLIEYSGKEHYPSLMLKFNNDMAIVNQARALLQSAPVPAAPAVPEEWREFLRIALDARPFITAETYGGRYTVRMRFEKLGEMQDCYSALISILQSAAPSTEPKP